MGQRKLRAAHRGLALARRKLPTDRWKSRTARRSQGWGAFPGADGLPGCDGPSPSWLRQLEATTGQLELATSRRDGRRAGLKLRRGSSKLRRAVAASAEPA